MGDIPGCGDHAHGDHWVGCVGGSETQDGSQTVNVCKMGKVETKELGCPGPEACQKGTLYDESVKDQHGCCGTCIASCTDAQGIEHENGKTWQTCEDETATQDGQIMQ